MTFSPSTNMICHEQLNMGSFHADVVNLRSKTVFINCGTATVNTLSGDGRFKNTGQLNMVGTAAKPAYLCSYHFENGYSSEDKLIELVESAYQKANVTPPSPHLNGAYITVGRKIFNLINRKNGQMDIQGDFKAKESNWFSNHGVWNHKGDLEFKGSKLWNYGMMHFSGDFVGDKATIKNTKEGTWRSEGKIDLDEVALENEGTMFWKYATLIFSPKMKKKSGAMWATAIPFENKGTWVIGSLKCAKWLDVVNHGTLQFDSGTLNLSSLENNKQLIFGGGCYAIENLHNNKGHITFEGRKWKITRDALPKSKSPYYHRQN